MKVVANICFVLALLFPAVLLVVRTIGMHGLELSYTLVFLSFALWICLLPALLITVGQGGFMWLGGGRGLQYALVFVASTSLVIVTAMSATLWNEPPDQVPWVIKPFLPLAWPSFVLPLIAIGGGMLALNPATAASFKPRTWRVPLAGAGGLAMLVVAGLIVELIITMNDETDRRMGVIVADAALRDEENRVQAEHSDPVLDLQALLGMTNIYNAPAVREAALKKLGTHPDLGSALAAHIRKGGCEDALIFLEGAAPPEPATLAEPVREAFSCMSARMRDDLKGNDMLYDGNFDAHTRRILAVADRFKSYGIDYAPQVREFRVALDTENPNGFKPSSRATIDRWLANQGAAKK